MPTARSFKSLCSCGKYSKYTSFGAVDKPRDEEPCSAYSTSSSPDPRILLEARWLIPHTRVHRSHTSGELSPMLCVCLQFLGYLGLISPAVEMMKIKMSKLPLTSCSQWCTSLICFDSLYLLIVINGKPPRNGSVSVLSRALEPRASARGSFNVALRKASPILLLSRSLKGRVEKGWIRRPRP